MASQKSSYRDKEALDSAYEALELHLIDERINLPVDAVGNPLRHIAKGMITEVESRGGDLDQYTAELESIMEEEYEASIEDMRLASERIESLEGCSYNLSQKLALEHYQKIREGELKSLALFAAEGLFQDLI